MKVRFWGVRGSLPAPLTPDQIQSKIMAVIQRATPADLESAESRAKFVSSLPSWIYGTTGGNTSCVEIQAGKTEIILDAGTGIRVLGKSPNKPADNHYHLLFSHFHWDHIQGLPFFDPAYNPNSTFDVYSAVENTRELLRKQMFQPYYPVPFEAFTKNFNFHQVFPGTAFKINDVVVNTCPMSHPGTSHSFSFEYKGAKFVYATDVELKADDFKKTKEAEAVFGGADAIVIDSQYTVEESYRKENWGHSAFCYAVDFAIFWNIKKLFLFHHEPTYDDKKLNSILQAARWYARYIEHSDMEINLAKESLELDL
ncbi:MAG: MBL fold metallo-hydrolase [Treponema sp.]|nr:MBL fold metallo-hydrolase [Treponema sp.]